MTTTATMGRIDVHSHLLPGVDDGCQSLADSLTSARAMVNAGYTHSFCTPHIWPSKPANTVVAIAQWTHDLQAHLDHANIPLRLMPGGEIAMRPEIDQTSPEEIVTFGMKRKHVLIDLWADRMPPFFKPAVRWLQSLGLTVVLAHPERMRMVQDDPEIVGELLEMGLLLQGNLQCLSDPPAMLTRRTIERILLEDRYFMLGSDLHGIQTLAHRLNGLQRAVEIVGEAKLNLLTKSNPRELL